MEKETQQSPHRRRPARRSGTTKGCPTAPLTGPSPRRWRPALDISATVTPRLAEWIRPHRPPATAEPRADVPRVRTRRAEQQPQSSHCPERVAARRASAGRCAQSAANNAAPDARLCPGRSARAEPSNRDPRAWRRGMAALPASPQNPAALRAAKAATMALRPWSVPAAPAAIASWRARQMWAAAAACQERPPAAWAWGAGPAEEAAPVDRIPRSPATPARLPA